MKEYLFVEVETQKAYKQGRKICLLELKKRRQIKDYYK